jgi:carbonic anhydrase/acetyltransferase-like protein (isoleucine patch superfamily)
LHETVFVAAGARLIGDITIGEGSSIWFNCVLRADVNHIIIGKGTNIQDGSIIHVDSGRGDNPAGYPTIIGDHVLIGHMAMVHGTIIEDGGFIGLGSVTMDGCYVEKDAMLAAGSLLSPKKRMKSRELWMGRPAKMVKILDDEAVKKMTLGASHYADLARNYLNETNS